MSRYPVALPCCWAPRPSCRRDAAPDGRPPGGPMTPSSLRALSRQQAGADPQALVQALSKTLMPPGRIPATRSRSACANCRPSHSNPSPPVRRSRGSEMSLHRPSSGCLPWFIALPAMAGPGNIGRPGGWESPAPQYGHGAGPGFGHRVDRLPGGVETLLLAGLTYYVLDGIFYRRQENHYVVVSPPPSGPGGGRDRAHPS